MRGREEQKLGCSMGERAEEGGHGEKERGPQNGREGGCQRAGRRARELENRTNGREGQTTREREREGQGVT